ncbi:MAG: hypothetical protein QOF36_2550 [Microbacteriaceae bacterium]|nr:hypothetical protein [Microbacteriaceae bacterium]
MDYTKTTWVDDDGSGTTGTVGTAARLNNIEDGIADAIAHNRIGTFAGMPAAAAGNKNWLYIVTDSDDKAGLYLSSGASWTKMQVGSLPLTGTLFGTTAPGSLYGRSDSGALIFNYNYNTDRLSDTSKPGWLVKGTYSGGDTLTVARAAATAGSPTWTSVFTIDSTGQITAVGSNHKFGTGALVRSTLVDGCTVRSNYDPATDRLLDTSKAMWVISVGDGTDRFVVYRAAPTAGSPSLATVGTFDSSALLTGAGNVRFGTGGTLRSATADNAALHSNYNPTTDRLIDTSKTAWQAVAGAAGDVFSVYRAPATAGSPAFVLMFQVASDGVMSQHNIRSGLLSARSAAGASNKGLYAATDDALWANLDGSKYTRIAATGAGFFGDGSDGAWTAQVTPTNVLANPDAESNTTGWAGFFTGGGAGSGPTRVSDAGAGSGSFAFELSNATASGAGILLMYPGGLSSFIGGQNVVPGQVVDFSGQMKAQAGTFTSLKLVARWLKADGTLISEVDVTGAVQNSPVVGTWYSLSGSLTAPPLAAYAGLEAMASFGGAGSYTMRADNLASRPIMPGATRSGSVYTLTRDVYFTDLTVNTGVSIVSAGYKVFVKNTLSGAGTISANGGNGGTPSTQSGGTGAAPGSVHGGYPGGAGGAINGNGNPVGTQGWSTGHGGTGGTGGASGVRTGGNPSATTPPSGGIRRSLPELVSGVVHDLFSGIELLGGGGGSGGGAGSTTAVGGGGGGAGGLLIVVARTLAGTLAFEAKGGNGAQGGANAGGGGAGGGGAIHLLYGDNSGWTGTTSVVAGAVGAANGTGAAGVAGTAGVAIALAI